MAEAKMNSTYDPYDPSLWVMDDSCPYDLSDIENIVLPKEIEEKLHALADEIFGPVDEVQSAA